MCVPASAQMHTQTDTQTNKNTHMYTRATDTFIIKFIQIDKHRGLISTHMQKYAHARISTHACVRTYIHGHLHKQQHILINKHTNIHTDAYTHMRNVQHRSVVMSSLVIS